MHNNTVIWNKKYLRIGNRGGNVHNWEFKLQITKIIYMLYFADNKVVLAHDKEDMEYIIRKLLEEYGKWGLNINLNI